MTEYKHEISVIEQTACSLFFRSATWHSFCFLYDKKNEAI